MNHRKGIIAMVAKVVETKTKRQDEVTDDDIRKAYRQAIDQGQRVHLHVKGLRPFVGGEGYGVYVRFESLPNVSVEVEYVCKLADIDAQYVHDLYFERWQEILDCGDNEERFKIWADRRRVVTDVLPFTEIVWCRDRNWPEFGILESVTRNSD